MRSVAFTALMLAPGCSGPVVSETGIGKAHDRSWPSFVARGDPATCPLRCKATAVTFLRAGLGLDPTARSEAKLDTEQILAALCSAHSGQGAQLERASLADCLGSLPIGPCDPVVLIHDNGHSYLLLGSIDIDGNLMYQVIHGNSPVWLLSKSQLENAGFREVWRLAHIAEGFVIHVGSAKLHIDKLFHNFGEIRPEQQLRCEFTLANRTQARILIGRVVTSCGCMTTSALQNTELAMGDKKVCRILIRSTNSASLRHSVTLEVFEKGTGVSKRIEFIVAGSQRQSGNFAPKKLDFALVAPGKVYSRSVRITEVPTDRFAVRDVDPGKLPLTYRIERSTAPDGLTTYRIRIKLRVRNNKPGKHAGELAVTTDSTIRPRLTIPVAFEVASPVDAMPSAVSFGTVSIGQSYVRRVRLLCRDGGRPHVTVLRAPAQCSVGLDEHAAQPELIIVLKLTKAGVWGGVIDVKVEVPQSGEHQLSIRCAAYGCETTT